MRIVFVIGELEAGGAEIHLLRILPSLREMGFSPIVYTLSRQGRLAPRLEKTGIAVETVFGREVLDKLPPILRKAAILPLTALTLLVLLRRLRPEIVHMFLPAAYLVGGAVSLASPVPIRVMSRRSRNHYQEKHPLAARFERLLHRRMSALLGNSRAVVADLIAEGALIDRVRLLYNGIPLDGPPSEKERQSVRTELGIAPHDLVMTITANLIPYKGHLDLVAALGVAAEALGSGWTLLCVGADRGHGTALRAAAEEVGVAERIQWLGAREDVARLLAASDIGVLCSHEEGFSNAVLEYMAAGLPSVVTDVGGNAEAVADGTCGLVVPPRDPSRLAQALLRLAKDPAMRERMGAAARARVERHFDIAVCVSAYASLYRALARGGPLPNSDKDLV